MLAFYPLVDPCVMSAMMNAMPWAILSGRVFGSLSCVSKNTTAV